MESKIVEVTLPNGAVALVLDLLAQCVVRIDRDGEFVGTGFFVAPGDVLTCAQVVHGGKPITVHTADGMVYPAEPITELLAPDDPQAKFYPQPDAAVLRLQGAAVQESCAVCCRTVP